MEVLVVRDAYMMENEVGDSFENSMDFTSFL